MSKKILPFPLVMKNGAKVRNIEELRANADVESIVIAYLNGKLNRWCKAFHYDNIPEKLDEVSEAMIRLIYETLGITLNEDELKAYLEDNDALQSDAAGKVFIEDDVTDCSDIKTKLTEYVIDKINLDDYAVEVTSVVNEDGRINQYKVILQNNKIKSYCSFSIPYTQTDDTETKDKWLQNMYKMIADALQKMQESLDFNSVDHVKCDESFVRVEGNGSIADFYICDHPVTQAEYQAVIGNNPSEFKGDDKPVENIDWYEAVDYCNERSKKEGLTPCYFGDKYSKVCDFKANGYRLATRDEWLYAARGGNKSNRYAFSGSDNLDEVAWYRDNSGGETHPVKQKKPNEIGLYDMSGNVEEWLWDEDRDFSIGNRFTAGRSWMESEDYCDYNHKQLPSDCAGANRNYRGLRVVKSCSDKDKNIKSDDRKQIPDDFVLVEGNGTVSDFYICNHPVIQKEYEEVIGYNPSKDGGAACPVENVTWYDAIAYCNKRSEKEGLIPCYTGNGENTKCNFDVDGYRLPTEVEWEFAASGGNLSKGYTYSGSDNINEVAWYEDNNWLDGTKPVCNMLPNELGICDMSGNVWEWCWDITNGSNRVSRGGSYHQEAYKCEVSYKGYGDDPNGAAGSLGFRVVRSAKK